MTTGVGQTVPYTLRGHEHRQRDHDDRCGHRYPGRAGAAGGASAVACPTSTLAPAQAMTCTATYTVTQADLDNGSVTDTAVATGLPPSGSPIGSPPSTVTIGDHAVAGSGTDQDRHDGVGLGGRRHDPYDFLVTNTGNVTVSTAVASTTRRPSPAPAAGLSA